MLSRFIYHEFSLAGEHPISDQYYNYFQYLLEYKGKYTAGGKRRNNEMPRQTHIGNVVAPLFAEQIGLALLEVLSHDRSQKQALI